MPQLNHNIELYIGSPIAVESERMALNQIVSTLNPQHKAAVIIANVNLSDRQIDLLIATENMVLVIEVKGCTRPIRGSKNGGWQYQTSTGQWRATDRNYYRQTLDGKNAVRDAMRQYNNKTPKYPDALLIFVPSLPVGSAVASSDFKVGIGDINLLQDFAHYKGGSDWTLAQWRDFANHHNLIKIENFDSAFDQQLAIAESLITQYKHSFQQHYTPQIQGLVPFPCSHKEQPLTSDDVANLAVKENSLLIVGPSGCGKSMLARQISLHGVATDIIPIIVEAKYFDNEFNQLLNKEVTLLHAPSIKALLSASKRLDKPLCIILDGYNECRQNQRQRLTRCLNAFAQRYLAGIVITAQAVHDELTQLALPVVHVPEPDITVKKAIANLAVEEPNTAIQDLLTLAKSGFEANIIGQIGKTITSGMSGYTIFDCYIRQKLGTVAQDGISALAAIGAHLASNITFSLSVREFDRLLAKQHISPAISTELLQTHLINNSGDKISFGHELLLRFAAAEAVIRACDDDAGKIIAAIAAPKHATYKTLIIGAIDNLKLLDSVLHDLDSSELIIACITGECGEYAQQWTENKYRLILQQIKAEAQAVRFSVDKSALFKATAISDIAHVWSINDHAFICTLPQLLHQGLYLDDVFEIVPVMEAQLKKASDQFPDETSDKYWGPKNALFSAAMVDQNAKIAISQIIAWLSIGQLNQRDCDTEMLRQWIASKLQAAELSNGQLYMVFQLCRFIWDNNPMVKALPALLKARWQNAPYHLRLKLIDPCRNDWNYYSQPERDQLIDIINGFETQNPLLTTDIVEVLSNLGGLEETEYENTVQAQLARVFSAPENPINWDLARSIYFNQFDHPYLRVYYEAIAELPTPKRKMLLTMAAQAQHDSFMFESNMIIDLASFGDKKSGKYIEPWTDLPDNNTVMMQTAIGIFITAHIVLGCIQYPMPTQFFDATDKDNAMLACGDIYYWLNRIDLSWHERVNRCEPARDILMQHELGVALAALKKCATAMVDESYIYRTLGTEPIKGSIIDSFPDDVAEISRQALSGKVQQADVDSFTKESDSLNYAILILGSYGKMTDLPLLHRLVEDKNSGPTAIIAIQQLQTSFDNG